MLEAEPRYTLDDRSQVPPGKLLLLLLLLLDTILETITIIIIIITYGKILRVRFRTSAPSPVVPRSDLRHDYV